MPEKRCAGRRRALPIRVILAALLLAALGNGAVSALDWQVETVDASGTVWYTSSLALDGAGHPRIAYLGGTEDLKYAARDGSGWRTEVVDAPGSVGLYASLALDSAGNPRISYYDDTNGDLKYAAHNGSAWAVEMVDPAGDVGWDSSLVLDGAGGPRISYVDLHQPYPEVRLPRRFGVADRDGGLGAVRRVPDVPRAGRRGPTSDQLLRLL